MDAQVLTGKIALGDLLDLARRAANELRVQDEKLADALDGATAHVELETHEAHLTPC
jgi:hypothetical protein